MPPLRAPTRWWAPTPYALRRDLRLRSVCREARSLWWELALAAHEAGADVLPYVNHHDAAGTAGLVGWQEGDLAGGESVDVLMGMLRDADLLAWDDEAREIQLLLHLPLLGEGDGAAAGDTGGDAADLADEAPQRSTRPRSTPARAPRAGRTTSAPEPKTTTTNASAAVLRNARFYFAKRERLWRDVPAGVSFEAWLASDAGVAWSAQRLHEGATPKAQRPVAPATGGGATGRNAESATPATGRNGGATPPSPTPSPSENTEKRGEKEGEEDAQRATRNAVADLGATRNAQRATPVAPVVAATRNAPRTNPLELLSEASRGAVRAMSGGATLITGPGEFRDQLTDLAMGDAELRAWGEALASETGRRASWPEEMWNPGDLKRIGPVVAGRQKITLDFLRGQSYGGTAWEFLRKGVEAWRSWKERAEEERAARAADRPAVARASQEGAAAVVPDYEAIGASARKFQEQIKAKGPRR